MRWRHSVAGAGGLVVTVAIACGIAWRATESAPGQPPAADAESSRHAALHARYAQARLRLAEVRLEKAEALNAASPGQLTETDMRALRSRVDVLREQVASARAEPHGYGFAGQRTAAHAAVRLAERHLEAARAVNGRHPDAFATLEVRLREVRLEIARLRVEIWDDPEFLSSSTAVLQMQIDQLADQLQDVLVGVENAPAIDRR